MAEPFKNIFNAKLVEGMARHFARVSPAFDSKVFRVHALDGLDGLEMLARAEQISLAIDAAFPSDFELKRKAMIAALHPDTDMELSAMSVDEDGIAGWAVEPIGRVIARHGLNEPGSSLAALREMTMRFSAEFAIRPFFRDHPDETLTTALQWADDPNHHVRRLASEGARPMLPWGIKLHHFVRDPSPLLPLLTKLRDDPSDYVRKSVANNLNDISKDHPDLVADLAKDWLKDAGKERTRLVKHACRTLIKQGHAGALEAFGFPPPNLKDVSLDIPSSVTLGDEMDIALHFTPNADQTLLIDYVLHFMRANGKLSPKVFKWTEVAAKSGAAQTLRKTHSYKPVTTRKDYPGAQMLSVQINGQEVARASFEFLL